MEIQRESYFREKIKSCYWSDLKSKGGEESQGLPSESSRLLVESQVQEGQWWGGKTEGSRAMLWPLNPTPEQGEGAVSVRRNSLVQAELFRAGSGAGRGSQSPVPRSHAQSHAVYGQKRKAEQEACPEEEEPHFSAQLPGKKHHSKI